jgi:hypothetical protein
VLTRIRKGLDFIEKKTGHTMGRDTNEKITDGVRGMYEKATGYVCFLSSRFSDPTFAGGIIIMAI